jgi:hypothetical protein
VQGPDFYTYIHTWDHNTFHGEVLNDSEERGRISICVVRFFLQTDMSIYSGYLLISTISVYIKIVF